MFFCHGTIYLYSPALPTGYREHSAIIYHHGFLHNVPKLYMQYICIISRLVENECVLLPRQHRTNGHAQQPTALQLYPAWFFLSSPPVAHTSALQSPLPLFSPSPYSLAQGLTQSRWPINNMMNQRLVLFLDVHKVPIFAYHIHPPGSFSWTLFWTLSPKRSSLWLW